MGSLGRTYNTEQMPEDDRNFEIIPSGTWLAMQVIESDVIDTKDRSGKILMLTLQVTEEGQYKNRQIWQGLNIVNQNPQAQEISEKLLRGIMVGIGLKVADNHEDLRFLPFLGRVGIEKSNDKQYPDKNKLTQAKANDGAAPSTLRPTTRTAAAPARSATPPARTAGARPTAATQPAGGRPWRSGAATAAPAQAAQDPDDIPF